MSQTPFVEQAIAREQFSRQLRAESSTEISPIKDVLETLHRTAKWDRRFMEMAKLVSTWSKDPSTKIGAVLVNPDNVVLGMGYNGFPRGVADTDERLNNRELKYKLVVHGEVNAILAAMKNGHDLTGSRLYVYPTLMLPNICPECAKVAAQAGIAEVIGYVAETTERWQVMAEASSIILEEAGIKLRVLNPEEMV